jgi:hypothetical protein
MKQQIKQLIQQWGWDIKRRPLTLEDYLKTYQKWQGTPWSMGYNLAKFGFIHQIINNPNLLKTFSQKEPLSEKFGIGFDERCVEYPWLLSHLTQQPATLLDAGSVLNFETLLNHSIFVNKKLHILTLAPESNCFWQKGISYLYEDLRHIPSRDSYYDAIICLSTLEHIGCDNTLYTQDTNYQENLPDDFLQAMQELRRVLKSGGSLFLSVPFGKYGNFKTFQQFDYPLLSEAIKTFGDTQLIKETFYQYTPQGWQLSTAQDCANCEYVQWLTIAYEQHQIPNPIPVEPDLAAAARAVACVQLIKA